MLGFAAGGESDITPYLVPRYFGLRGFSTLYGMAWTAYAAGAAVGPVLMGKLYVLATTQPEDEALYRERGRQVAELGYVSASKIYLKEHAVSR